MPCSYKENARASIMYLCWCSAHVLLIQHGLHISGCSGCPLTAATGFPCNQNPFIVQTFPLEPMKPNLWVQWLVSSKAMHKGSKEGLGFGCQPESQHGPAVKSRAGRFTIQFFCPCWFPFEFWRLTGKRVQASDLSSTLNKNLSQKETIMI